LGKKFYNSLNLAQIFFFNISEIKLFNFVKFMAQKIRYDKKIFLHPCLSLLFLDPGSGIRDPGSGINIPDPQH
jgi:hypothetical protein